MAEVAPKASRFVDDGRQYERKWGRAMADTVPVRCPACRRDHLFASPVYPCACGAPLAPPLLRAARPEPITHRTWTDDWVTVRCFHCGRQDHWPQPELGCPCGAVLRIPVRPVSAPTPPEAPPSPARPARIPLPRTATVPRPSFRPVTIRTERDAVTAAALRLRGHALAMPRWR